MVIAPEAPPFAVVRPSPRRNRSYLIAVVGCCVILAAAVGSTSLWIDEGYIAWLMGHGSLSAVLAALTEAAVRPADRQYPLYDLWEWTWVHLFGSSEYALRSANIPFAVVYVCALAWTSRSVFRRDFGWIPFAFTPFIWFYMNEVRPYMMLAAFATCAVSATLAATFGTPALRPRALPFVLPAVALTLMTHILGIMLLPGLGVLMAAASITQRQTYWPQWRRSIIIWAVPLALITAFYAATLGGNAARAEITNNQGRGPSPVASAAEIVYEQAGFAGLGPARNTLRAGIRGSDFVPFLPWLLIGIGGFALTAFRASRSVPDRISASVFLAWLSSIVGALVLAELMHARFLGRHLAATLPLLVFAVMSVVRERIGAIALLVVFVVSDIRLSAVGAYAKDDYRDAVSHVSALTAARPGTIAWVADDLTANYYGMGFDYRVRSDEHLSLPWPVRLHAVSASEYSPDQAQALVAQGRAARTPLYVVVSKPDIFDEFGGWKATIARHRAFQVASAPAFSVYVFEPNR